MSKNSDRKFSDIQECHQNAITVSTSGTRTPKTHVAFQKLCFKKCPAKENDSQNSNDKCWQRWRFQSLLRQCLPGLPFPSTATNVCIGEMFPKKVYTKCVAGVAFPRRWGNMQSADTRSFWIDVCSSFKRCNLKHADRRNVSFFLRKVHSRA